MRPNSPANAVAVLSANLESSRNSSEETLTIAASLLEAAPGDASNLHRVLAVASNRSDSLLTNGVLRQLGLSKTHLPEAIAFISTNLGHADPYIGGSAVDAAASLTIPTECNCHHSWTGLHQTQLSPKRCADKHA
jgi:hypothetical protein